MSGFKLHFGALAMRLEVLSHNVPGNIEKRNN
jgi:hypothetical protein